VSVGVPVRLHDVATLDDPSVVHAPTSRAGGPKRTRPLRPIASSILRLTYRSSPRETRLRCSVAPTDPDQLLIAASCWLSMIAEYASLLHVARSRQLRQLVQRRYHRVGDRAERRIGVPELVVGIVSMKRLNEA
jgi:hypothetical protein